jgi:hypothetical protein
MTISVSDDIDDTLCQLSNKTGIRYGAIFSSYVTITMDNKGDVSVIDEIIKYSIDLGINFSTLIGNDDNARRLYISLSGICWPRWVEDPSEFATYVDTIFGAGFIRSEGAAYANSMMKKMQEIQEKMYEQRERIWRCEDSI